VPMAISFSLQGFAGATPLQAFAAGAALCSTSLGTTFTILGTTGLSNTRLGVVLTSAAMLDDIVGLVLVQVVSNLGGASAVDFGAVTVIRPVFVSIGFALLCPLVCFCAVRPLNLLLNRFRETYPSGSFNKMVQRSETVFVMHTLLLLAMVTGSSYAGTSNLFAGYLAGAIISWWDSELPRPRIRLQDSGGVSADADTTPPNEATADAPETTTTTTGMMIYESYYAQVNERILKPFFFVSPNSNSYEGSKFPRKLTV
jgi:Kef-type K+ transport system membrane component KefB